MTDAFERRLAIQVRRPACGAPMRDGERCARRPDHDPRYGHRTAYSLDNLRRARARSRDQRAGGS